MLTTDIYAPPFQSHEPMLVARAELGKQAIRADKVIWSGQTVEQDGGIHDGFGEMAQGRILAPAGEAIFLLESSGWLQQQGIVSTAQHATAVLETVPKYGKIEAIESGEYKGLFRYKPNSGFFGRDFVSFIVSVEGKKVRVMTPLYVVKNIDEPKAQLNNAQSLYSSLRDNLTK